MPIVPEGYGQAGGGRGGSIGEYQGQFTATTVKQRAFDADDYIVFDNGTKLVVFLAPVDIPVNSPAPGESGALWGELDTAITSGISSSDLTARLQNYALSSALGNAVNNINTSLNGKVDATDFHTALGTKADTDALTDYLRTATYNLDKARLESGITGNDNDISALMSSLSALQTTVNNLPSGGGGTGGGDVTTQALNNAINNLRTALQASIDAKQDADTAATDAELATAVMNLRTALQGSIDILTTQVGNIPITSDLLWATSKPFLATVPRETTVFDTDWTLGDDASTGVVVSGDYVHIPREYRGELHVDMEASDGSFLQRLIVPVSVGVYEGFDPPFFEQLQVRIDVNPSDSTLLRLYLYVRGSPAREIQTAGVGGRAKVYGVTALRRAEVIGITQAQLDAALEALDVLYIDPNRRYATLADLRKNWVFYFSHVPERYKSANIVSISWDGVIAYKDAWTPSTEYIFFAINPTQLQNLDDVVTQDTSKLLWRVQITFLQGETTLGIETVPIIIDRG